MSDPSKSGTFSDKFSETILDNIRDGVYFVDTRRKIHYWNKGAEKITGYSREDMVGKMCYDGMLNHVDDDGCHLCSEGCPLEATMLDGQPREVEVYLHHREGHRLPVRVFASPIRDASGKIMGAVETFSDNSDGEQLIKRMEELEKQALMDHLTETANRRFMEMTLRTRLTEMERYQWPFGVILYDVDHFKSFNDKYGHDIGDRVLKMVSRTMAANLRQFDVLGRWGGEEFLAIVANTSEETLRNTADRLRSLVESSHFVIENKTVSVTVSGGMTMALPHDSIETLVNRADKLLYEAKEGGRNRVAF